MKVATLIKKLQKCDKNAKVLITIGDEEFDTLSTSDFDILHADDSEYIELFVNENTCSKQV